MGDLLRYHAEGGAARPAITFGGTTLTYAQLDERTNRRARHLADLGVGEGDVVTIAMAKGIAFYEAVFAVWKLGATPNPVSASLPAAERQAILELAKPRLVIGPEGDDLPGWEVLGAGAFDAPAPHSPARLSAPPAKNWKIMTSGGSTGRPKLIVDGRAATHDPRFPVLTQVVGDTVLNPGPLYHNTPFTVTMHCLFTGGHVIEMERFDPLRTLELIETHKVGWISLVPTMMHRIWRLPEDQRLSFDLSSLRVVFHNAAACPVWLKQEWIDWLGPDRIIELYGGTEGQGFTVINGREWLAHKGSVGRVVNGSRLSVRNDAGGECAPGEIGTIYFLPESGKGSTYRYVGAEPQALGDWESLGDLGYLDEDGFLFLADRRKDLIISGGANIYPAEVEAALDAHPMVLSSIAVGLPDADMGQRVHAIVQVGTEKPDPSEDALREFLGTRLARYKIPKTFEFTSEALRDDAGKARRSKLAEDRADTSSEG
ncbi:acid--CoA ligase [Novosphingobium sp. PC22D]|nr:acid--CoA ligase [Novosphingobium sp. PC22D]